MTSGREIKVGISMSLTGPFALQGQHAFDGIRLWESHINAREGIACNTQGQRHVRLVVYDDQSRVRLAQENARRLLEQDRVDILLGPYSSALTIGVAQVAEEHGKLLWNHGGASDKMFSLGHRHVVSTISPASEYFRELPHHRAPSRDPPGECHRTVQDRSHSPGGSLEGAR